MTKAQKDALIEIAGELVRRSDFSPYREDWPTPLRWAEVERRAERAQVQDKGWALRLRTIADGSEVE